MVSLLLCIGGGILLDRWLDTSPVFTLSGMALGLVSAGYSLYELAVLGSPARGVIKLRNRQPGAGQEGGGAAAGPGRSTGTSGSRRR